MQRTETEVLQHYIESLAALSEIGVPGAREQKDVYCELMRLSGANPFEKPTAFSLTAGSGAWHSAEVLRRLFEAAEETFTLQDSKADPAYALDNFISDALQEGHHLFAEGKILLGTAERWRRELHLAAEEKLLTIEIALSLELRYAEEDLGDGEARVMLPLVLTNRGNSQISGIAVRLEANTEGLKLEGGDTRSESHFTKELEALVLRGRERLSLTIPFAYKGHGSLKIWVDYAPRSEGDPRDSSNSLEIELVAKLRGQVERIPNPYVPDLPLLSESQWKTLAKGSHKDLLAHLVNDTSLEGGRVLVVHGCRRTGKTSLLRRLSAEVEKGERVLPVYVDLYLWHLELGEKKENALNSREALYYELAAATLDSIDALLEPEDETGGATLQLLDKYATAMALPAHEFTDFMKAIKEKARKPVLLIIDEFDWWVNRLPADGSASSILAEFTTFAAQGGAFSVIFSHDLTSPGWEAKYKKGGLSKRVRFLKPRDVEALTRVVEGIQFSGLAVDFLWRMSGGWPGLAQLLCYEAVEVLRRGKSSHTVDVSVMSA